MYMNSPPIDELVIRPSFALPFANTELWCFELDALYAYTDIVQRKFLAELAALKRPCAPSLVIVHLTKTFVSKELVQLIIDRLIPIRRIRRIAFAGLSLPMRAHASSLLGRYDSRFSYGFFPDYEQAKVWLVSSPV